MSRAKEKVRLARMGEQPGFMGIGRFEVDTYYNDIRHRMNAIKLKLEKSHRQRELHRSGRQRMGWDIVSLAGYTSAGKTTLFNTLTGEQKEQDAKLFTTLSTTTRRAKLGGKAVLVSDTVGFISRLPAYMIKAFHSTLEEMIYANVILLVVDFSEDLDIMVRKHKSCQMALGEIGVFGETLDITLGQLLDQFGRSLGFASPCGRRVEKLASKSSKYVQLPYSVRGNDVSFSGLLSAAKKAALDKKNAGGVAANSRLSAMLKGACKRHKAKLYTVSPKFSGDCGSQIACVGMLECDIYGGVKIKDAFVRQSWRLDGVDVNY